MNVSDYGKAATCGLNGKIVVVSHFNSGCLCLDCGGCQNTDNKLPCKWRYVLETEPDANQDMRATMCASCIKYGQQR